LPSPSLRRREIPIAVLVVVAMANKVLSGRRRPATSRSLADRP
jgi:hypothetical protein